jgi:RNA polymerase sigma-70 factor (ECF subfamily)
MLKKSGNVIRYHPPLTPEDSMNTTPVSLLERLHAPGDQSAWERFVDLYTPLLYHWGRCAGLQESDVADLVQDVFQILVQKLPTFAYDRNRTFRGWLRTVLLNQWRATLRRRTEHPLDPGEVAVGEGDVREETMEKEYRDYLVTRALHVMKTDFQPTTWQACWEHVARGRPVSEVASELGITVRAVYLAKGRVLRRLREELAGLWD